MAAPIPVANANLGLDLKLSRSHILVVDDEPRMLTGLCELLRMGSYEVTAANSGRVAIELLHKGNFDLVLLDLNMPGTDGFAVMEHIERVTRHARRLEQSAETVVQIHFSAQSNRTNDIMRTLTALTAIFLPLNLIAGIFGMNFEFLPFIHAQNGFFWALGGMALIAATLVMVFWRKRYLARTRG